MPNRYSKAVSAPNEFRRYFTENMHALGLSTPSGYFETFGKATETAGSIAYAIDQLGGNATLSELHGATFFKEKLNLINAGRAALYLGAVVGSIAVAAGRIIGSGTQIADLYFLIHRKEYQFLNGPVFYNRHKEIIDPSINNRKYYAVKVKTYSR